MLQKKMDFRFLAKLLLSGVMFTCLLLGTGTTAQAVTVKNDNFTFNYPDNSPIGDAFLFTCTTSLNCDDVLVEWRGKKILLGGQGTSAEALLSIPLESKEKSIPIVISDMSGKKLHSGNVRVVQKDYPTQELQVEPKYVSPPDEMKPIIKEQNKITRGFLNQITPIKYWTLPLQKGVPGGITSEFGMRRVFNGQPKNPHKGTDLRGAEGTPIYAIAAGKVVLVEDFYYSGKHVLIDHGLGVHSLYAHMSEPKATVGQLVEAGELIGLVGATGRVTGPHLHLGFYVLGVAVNAKTHTPGMVPVEPSAEELQKQRLEKNKKKVSKKNASKSKQGNAVKNAKQSKNTKKTTANKAKTNSKSTKKAAASSTK